MIQKGREKLANPRRAIVGELRAVLAFPKGDHRNQSGLLVGNQQQAACESRNLSECAVDRCRNGRPQPVRLLGFGHKLDAQRGHTASRSRNRPAHLSPRVPTNCGRRTHAVSEAMRSAPTAVQYAEHKARSRIRTPRALGFLLPISAAHPRSVSGILRPLVPLLPETLDAILPFHKHLGSTVELFAFDAAYVGRLREGDPQTELHFVSYFEQLLRIKLRARMLAQDTVDELSQETLRRVIAALRTPGGVRQPERFGAFVNSICNNVLMEFYRSSGRHQQLEEFHLEKTDRVLEVESSVATQEMCQHIRRILQSLPRRDRQLLRAIFFEEKDKDEICRLFHVDRGYLRVLLHRAKDKFRAVYLKENLAPRGRALGKGSA